MADNVTFQSATPATPPAGTIAESIDVGGGIQRQVIQVEPGTDPIAVTGAVTGTVTTTPPAVTRTQVTPTVSTSPAYTTKDAVGALMTFAGVVAAGGNAVQVLGCKIVDKSQQMKDYDLVLFDRSITAPTDNAIFDPTDTELGYVIDSIPVGGWLDFNDNSVFAAEVNIVDVLNGTSLYAVLVSRSSTGPTFAGTSDIVVTLTTADLG